MTWALITEQWVGRALTGEIKYDPRGGESRWVVAAEGTGRFKVIFNSNRKARLEPKAA